MVRSPDSKSLRKKFCKCVLETENATDVSVVAFLSSPVSISDSSHLRRKLIQTNFLKGDFCAKKADSEMHSAQSNCYRNDWSVAGPEEQLSEVSNVDYRFSSEKTIHLEVAEGTNSSLNSENGTRPFGDLSSFNVSGENVTTDCASGCEQSRKPSSRRSISALCKRDVENDFLQAVLTPVKSANDQDSSYEDYFSPANFNKNKIRIRLPIQCRPKSQYLPDVCKDNPSQSAMLQDAREKETTCSKKRKRVSETHKNVSTTTCLPTTPKNKKRTALNCMPQRVKGELMEAPDSLLNHNIQSQICTASVNGCSPSTGKSLLRCEHHESQPCEPFKVV